MFKTLTIYQLTQATEAVAKKIESGLPSAPFSPCKPSYDSSHGFVKPLGESSDVITYETDNALLFCLRRDTKTVPTAAIKLMLEEWMEDREVSPVDIRVKREEMIEAQLPTTLPVPRWTYAYLDKTLAMLMVGTGEEDADEFLKHLSVAIEAMPFKLLGITSDPCEIFTRWFGDTELLEGFELGDGCSMKHPKEGGTAVINISHEDLESEDLAAMITAGKQVCRVKLHHEELTFAINAKLNLKSMSLGEGLKSELEEQDGTSYRSASEFAMYVRAVRQVLADLEPLLGGWPKQEWLDLHDTEAAE